MQYTSIILAALLAACTPAQDPHRVVGELESDRVELAVDVYEPVVEILVDEGAGVSRGDVLLRQDATRARARLAEADAGLAEARARLDELVRGPREEQIAEARANVDGAERDHAFRESEFRRVQEIHARDLASPEQLDRAGAALETARATLDARRARLRELLAGTTIEELAQAENAVRRAEANRDAHAVNVDRHTLRAPVDGVLDSRLFEIGETPSPGQPAIVMLSGTQPYARVYVPEALRAKVAPGDAARVLVDGLEQRYRGRVRWVANEASFTPYYALTERDRGRLSYLAKVDILDADRRLPDGVPVEVEFGPLDARR